MQGNGRSIFALFAIVGLALRLILPSLANADGGPILSDPELWPMIDEGQQIAVIHSQKEDTLSWLKTAIRTRVFCWPTQITRVLSVLNDGVSNR
jgi:hypothetical protein